MVTSDGSNITEPNLHGSNPAAVSNVGIILIKRYSMVILQYYHAVAFKEMEIPVCSTETYN